MKSEELKVKRVKQVGMKAAVFIIAWIMALGLGASPLVACVNLDINVGTIDSVEGRLFAEIISTFIHERTGTKAIIKFYPDSEALHAAIAEQQVELIVANPAMALQTAGRPLGRGSAENLQAARAMYKNDLQLVMLEPFGVVDDENPSAGLVSPVLAKIVLEKFPALPRLLNKLAGKIDAAVTAQLLALVNDKGEKPARVAKDFLVAKRLI